MKMEQHIKSLALRVFCMVTLLSLCSATPVNAGLSQWVTIGGTAPPVGTRIDVSTVESPWSLDSIYTNILTITPDTSYSNPSFQDIQLNSVHETAEHESPSSPARRQTKRVYRVVATAYSSTLDQTDSTPFITANGSYVRDGIIATNFLPFGTVVKVPELYGDKVFVVEDRMNARYWRNIDIWFPDRQSAKEFGRQSVTIEIL